MSEVTLTDADGTIRFRGTLNGAAGGDPSEEVALTNADIKAFGAGTAVDVVPAPGLGKVIRLVQAFLTVDAVAVPYGNIDAAAYLSLDYSGSSSASLPLKATGGLLALMLGADGEVTFATFLPLHLATATQPFDASEGENLPLGLTGFNGVAGPFDGGDAANSGRVKVTYTIETLA